MLNSIKMYQNKINGIIISGGVAIKGLVCLRSSSLERSMDFGANNGVSCKTSFLIAYASQTGNAKAIAEDIAEQCEAKGLIHHQLSCVSECEKKFSLERTSCLVLVGSTTGDGDPPDPARKFWRQLNKKGQLSSALSHLSYTILGLGDTNYTNFCNFGKSVDKRLQDLGAKRFYPCGWADDGTGLEIVVEPWIEGLFTPLKHHLMEVERPDSMDNDTKSEIVSGCNGKCSNASPQELSNICDNVKQIVTDEICVENSGDIMKKDKSVLPAHMSRTSTNTDVWKIAAKYGLCLLSQEQIQDLPVKSSAFSSDAKLSVPVLPIPYLSLRYLDDVEENVASNFTFPITSAASSITEMKLISVKTLTSHDAVKTALEVTLETTDSVDLFDYVPGDSFGVVVKNSIVEVELLLALLGLTDLADRKYELTVDKNTKKKLAAVPKFMPSFGSLRYVFENCVEIRSVPKKTFLRTLVEYTVDPAEQRRLKELVSKEGSAEYSKHVREANLSLIDLLMIFQSCKPPVATLLEHLPQLQPRAYSAVSSPLCDKKRISFAFNVVEINQGQTVTFPRKGVCTGWLSSFVSRFNEDEEQLDDAMKNLSIHNKKNGIRVDTYLRNNQNFHLPKDNTVPIVMVGPGTGVAPFVGFLRHRQIFLSLNGGVTFGESWLFFGCRHRRRDFLFCEELEKFHNDKVLNHLIVSFSRDENSPQSPKYVQDNIIIHGADLVPLIVNDGAIIYVCGDAKSMAKDVFEAFVSILVKNNGMSEVEARKFIAQMQIDKRYLQDVWA